MAETEAFAFYEVLGVTQDATPEAIRRAYLQRARECHPDKNPSEDAKAQFQQLQRIYAVLSNPEKRALYDTVGTCDESGDGLDGRFGAAPITEEDIEAFAREYLGSDVEKEDLLENYRRFKGNMEKVFETQILSDLKFDAHRFVDILDGATSEGGMRSYKSYQQWREGILKTRRRDVSFEKRFRKSKAAAVDEMALIEKIRNRGAKHMAFVNDLKTRFCGTGPTPYDEITEEEFQTAQARLLNPTPAKKRVTRSMSRGIQKHRSTRFAKKARRQ